MTAAAIQQMADRVARLLEERLGLGGRDLPTRLKRAGRRLPRKVRESGQLLATAAEWAQHPKLLGRIDMGEVSKAYDICLRHLMAVDRARRRRDLVAGMIASVGFGVLTLLLVLFGILVWRGDL